jgi:MFS family permease
MISTISGSIAEDFGAQNPVLQRLYGTIFLLGIAFGSVFAASLSEEYGRLPVYHVSNIALIGTLIGCSKASSPIMFLILRTVSGIASCCSLVLGGPTIRDIVCADEQFHSKILWSLCRLCPLFGYVAAQFGTTIARVLIRNMDWRAIFRCLTIGVSQLPIDETH